MPTNSNSDAGQKGQQKEKQLCFNAGIFSRRNREIKEILIVADEDRNGRINNKIPGGMQEESHADVEQWFADVVMHFVNHGFSEEQIDAFIKYERNLIEAGKIRSENERGVIHEIAEEVGLYAAEVEHVHFQLGNGNVRQNFFFVKKYMVPDNPPSVFKSNDKDVKKKIWVDADELLVETPKPLEDGKKSDHPLVGLLDNLTIIFRTHKAALEKYMASLWKEDEMTGQMELADKNSDIITIEDLTL